VTWCVSSLTLFALGSCSTTPSQEGELDAPLTSQALVGFESVGVTEARQQIVGEAKQLSVSEVQQYPYGDQIVDSQGNLKVNVSLGIVTRVYSLMNNSQEAADAELVGHPDRYYPLANDSIRRDLSDWYMATVSADGLGKIGEIWAPVYDVYRKTSVTPQPVVQPLAGSNARLNVIAYKSYQAIQPASLYTTYVQAGASAVEGTITNKNLYWFSLPDGDSEVVYIQLKGQQILLRAPLSKRTYKLEFIDQMGAQAHGVHKFEYQGQPASITLIGGAQ
jgi:hypothetical protein